MLRALIYNRVSSDPSGRQVSVKSQDVENHALCDQQGWHVAGVVTDNDRSASRHAVHEREGYRRVKTMLAGSSELGRIDVLVSSESSRNQRDLDDYVILRKLCTAHRVLLAYKGRIYDMARGGDRFVTGLDALLAERESDDIRDRVMRGIRARAAAGAPHGTVFFGYAREYDPHSGALLRQVPDPVTAPIVQEIVARVVAGESLYGIAADLTWREVPTPQQYKDQLRGKQADRDGWTSSKIRRLLSSSSVVGVRTHHGVAHPMTTWEPLVSTADHDTVSAILSDPARAVHHRGVQVAHLLSGLAECGPCGAWLRAANNRGRSVYQCAGRGDSGGKGHVSRTRELLDSLATRAVVMRLSDPELLVTLAADSGPDAAAAGREMSGMQARLRGLEDDVAAGRMSGAAFGRIEARLLERIADARSRARQVHVPSAVLDLAGPTAEQTWDRMVGRGYEGLMQRREAIRALLRIVIHRSVSPRGSHVFDLNSVEITPR